MTGSEHISQEDLMLHALQTLAEAESAAVRAHLAQCATCRNELAEVSGDAVLVGLSVLQYPAPVGARQRLLDRIAADASIAKQTVRKEARGQVLPFLPKAWIPWAAAAALAILSISLGAKINSLNKELRDASTQLADLRKQSAEARQVLEVLTSRSAQRVLLTTSEKSIQPTGRAFYLADSGGLVFQANNLKLLASDKTYELWVIPVNGKPIPAGLFRPDGAGSASVVLPPLPRGVPAKAFAVTIEKAAGSDTPTAPIILLGAIA
jgi:Anti-sigma-K factor rskA/Putative zinc-finger